MPIYEEDGKVRVTKSEGEKLRNKAAENGVTIGGITTTEDLLEAQTAALDDDTANDLLDFLEPDKD